MSDGHVYVLEIVDRPGLVKVGKTTRTVDERLADLQTGQPDTYRVATSWASANVAAEERRVHRLLAGHHHRGEWFRCTPAEVVAAAEGGPAARARLLVSRARRVVMATARVVHHVLAFAGVAALLDLVV